MDLKLERDAELVAAYDRGRTVGRADIAKYSNAIGLIESAIGYAGARPLSATVHAVELAIHRSREDLRSAHESLEVYEGRIREIADDIMGLQDPTIPAIVLLDAIAREYHRVRIEGAAK